MVLQYLPKLRFLDSSAVRKSEIKKARKLSPITHTRITNIPLHGSKVKHLNVLTICILTKKLDIYMYIH